MLLNRREFNIPEIFNSQNVVIDANNPFNLSAKDKVPLGHPSTGSIHDEYYKKRHSNLSDNTIACDIILYNDKPILTVAQNLHWILFW